MGSTLVYKIFKTLHEAVEFSNKSIKNEDLYEIVKVD